MEVKYVNYILYLIYIYKLKLSMIKFSVVGDNFIICLILYFIRVLSTQGRFLNFQLLQTLYTYGHALVNYHKPGYNSVLHATHVRAHLINCMYISRDLFCLQNWIKVGISQNMFFCYNTVYYLVYIIKLHCTAQAECYRNFCFSSSQ